MSHRVLGIDADEFLSGHTARTLPITRAESNATADSHDLASIPCRRDLERVPRSANNLAVLGLELGL